MFLSDYKHLETKVNFFFNVFSLRATLLRYFTGIVNVEPVATRVLCPTCNMPLLGLYDGTVIRLIKLSLYLESDPGTGSANDADETTEELVSTCIIDTRNFF